MPQATDLNLLLVHADDHAPVLGDGLPELTARVQGDVRRGAQPGHFWDEGGDPNDLRLQRWGVLVPDGPRGDRLLALVRPLIELRREQQGDDVKVYRVPPDLSQEEAARWRKRNFETGADLNIELPRYQLILGDLDEVSPAIQQIQGTDGFVGRLAFADEGGYEAYVEKVLRWERRPYATDRARALFYTVHDGTAATGAGHRALIVPGVDVVRQRLAAGQFPARDVVDFGDRMSPSPDELLRRAAEPEPGVLFSLSHGEGAPRGGWHSYEEQRRRQGSMSFGREGKLTGADLAGRTFLPGGVWFMLACYGAGTPSNSAYKHWLEGLYSAGQFRGRVEVVLEGLPGKGDRPFVAALPQAALASPDGPLAFIGHIDLAWTYSFQELDSGAVARPARFMQLVRALHKRDRLGVAMRELYRFFDLANTELTSLIDQEAQARSIGTAYQADPARQGHLWMLRQDLAGYIALGDPAVRLPLTDGAAALPAPPPAREASSGRSFVEEVASPAPPAASGPPPAAAPAPVPEDRLSAEQIERIEDAIAHVMLGDQPLRAIAEQLGRPRSELVQLAAAYCDAGRRAIRDTK